MPCLLIAKAPVKKPRTAATAAPVKIASSGEKGGKLRNPLFAVCAAMYEAKHKNIACQKESSPPKPTIILKAQAKRAKHRTSARTKGKKPSEGSAKISAPNPIKRAIWGLEDALPVCAIEASATGPVSV